MSGTSIKEGSVTVKVYDTPTPGIRARKKDRPPVQRRYKSWTVVHHFAGKRTRKKFNDRGVALAQAKQIALRLTNGQTAVLQMTSADQASFARVQQLNSTTGKPLEVAVGEYVEALGQLNGTPLAEAVRFYKEHHRENLRALKVPELVQKFLASKRDQNLSGVHLDDLDTRCARFAKTFQCPITAVTRGDLTDWLQGLKDARTGERLGPRSRNNYRAAVLNLVEFAKANQNAPKDWDDLTTLPAAKCPDEEIQIWTPTEMQLLLTGAATALAEHKLRFDIVPYLAIGAFAGPRQAEIARLDWRKNVQLQTRQIHLGKEITKTEKGRTTPIADNLAAWLKPYQVCHGPICRYRNISNALLKLAAHLGLPWKHNALRHSYITYRVALTGDVGKTSLEAGNSVQEIHDSYLDFKVTADEAKSWFTILPADTGQKILALNFG